MSQLSIVRRQLTYARKRIRQLEAERDPAGLRVVRWAKRCEIFQTRIVTNDWALLQLQRAVKALKPKS